MPSQAAMIVPERTTVSESVKPDATMGPTEIEIAAVAYQLWQDNGCPTGSDQEDWFRAEAMLKNGRVANSKNLSEGSSIPKGDTPAEFELLADFRWEGNWVVWESEWGGPRWIWDLPTPGVEVSERAA